MEAEGAGCSGGAPAAGCGGGGLTRGGGGMRADKAARRGQAKDRVR
jgi:hypothetical protein